MERTDNPEENENALSVLEATLSCLWLMTPLSATVSLILVVVGMATNQWLHTSEKMPNPSFNGTGEKDYLLKLTVSGLWVFCYTNPGDIMYQCDMIEYFSQEVYSPDPNDSSQAIPYAVTKSIVFVLLGSIFVVIGFIVCLMGQCMDNKSRYTLISGVIFIQTGLAMLCGLVVYIAVFKSEVGSKLRPKSLLQPAAFEYQYGYSFIVYVTGVVFTKASGVSCVFLYIYRAQYGWRRHQLKYAKENSITKTVNTFPEQEEPPILYPCERHPQAYINSNSSIRYTRNPLLCEKTYFSRKQNNVAPCRIHHRISQSNSLKDISIFYNFPPPPLVSYKFGHHLSANDLENFESFSRDATANTMSTTCDEFITNDDYLLSGENEFVTFEFDKPSAKRIFEMDSLRRTTPV